MSDISEALKYVGSLKDTINVRSEVQIDGRTYSRGALNPVHTPTPTPLSITTLTGFADYTLANKDKLDLDNCMVIVDSPSAVRLCSNLVAPFAQRFDFLQAEPEQEPFQFNRHMGQEAFLIGLASLFTADGGRDQLLVDVASIHIDQGADIEDNGISQTVATKTGARLLTKKSINPRVALHPYCTFPEIPQPRREFLFRLDQNGSPALYVADGEAWRGPTMLAIKAWLAERLPKELVILA